MNVAHIIGNLGDDPVTNHTRDGMAVCNFSVASSEYGDKVEWHHIVAWDKKAELCSKYLAKGKKVAISGKLQTRRWEDKDGVKRNKTEIVALNVEFLTPRTEENPGFRSQSEVPGTTRKTKSHSQSEVDLDDDNIPF